MERKLLLEPLEERRLLASGPRLTGLQPNNSDLFSFTDPAANVRSEAPKELTIRFDENQRIDPSTLSGIRIVRGGSDGIVGNQPQDVVVPGFIGVGSAPLENEVVVRFAESLPDDVYQIEIFGVGSATPLRSLPAGPGQGSLEFVPTLNDGDNDITRDTVHFELDLGPQVLAVVPQPIVRGAGNVLTQARNKIQVYFNNDDMLRENDSLGRPLPTSVESPLFYQLILTRDTVRNTDDVVIYPSQVGSDPPVVYDPATDIATLTFAQDLDRLLHPDTGALLGPGTFRLRVGTNEAAPLPPMTLSPVQEISTDFNTGDRVVVQFTSVHPGEFGAAIFVTQRDLGGPGAPLVRVIGRAIAIDLNSNPGNESTALDVVTAINRHVDARQLVAAAITSGDPATVVGDRPVNYSPLEMRGMGDSFETAASLSDDTELGPVIAVVGGGIAFQDGDFFEIRDLSNLPYKLEFDSDLPESLNDTTAIPIPFQPDDSQSEVARAILQAINGASIPVIAALAGNEIHLSGDSLVDLSSNPSGLVKRFLNRFDNGQVLEVVSGGNDFPEGQTFQVTDAAGNVRTLEVDSGYTLRTLLPPLSIQVPAVGAAPGGIEDGQTFSVTDGLTTVVFEFDSDLIPNTAIGNTPIRFNVGDSADTLGTSIVAAINQAINLGQLVGISVSDRGGGQVVLATTDAATTGLDVDVTLSTLARLALDGQIWTITQNAVVTTFEFTHDDVFVDLDANLQPDHVLIRFSLMDAEADIAARIADTIRRQSEAGQLIGLGSLDLKDGRVHLGGTTATTIDLSLAPHLGLDTIPSVTAGNVPVIRADHPSFTANDMARAIATAVNTPGAPFAAQSLAIGNRVQFTNDRYVHIPAAVTGLRISLQGRFDAGPTLRVTQAGSRFVDGESILLRDDRGSTGVVEFDDDGVAVDPAAQIVTFDATTTQTELAERITDAINGLPFRVQATVVGNQITLTNDRDVVFSRRLTGIEKASQGLILSSSIDPLPYLLDFPGNNDEPGHREIPQGVGNGAEQHINRDFGSDGRDTTPGPTTILYNFRSDYGQDPQGNPLQNAVTDGQKQRARDAFSLWSKYLGVQFIESEREGLTIATGDLRALDPNSPDVLNYTANDFRVRVDPELADGLLLMDSAQQWNDDFGGNWFVNAMIGIGSMLGLDRANDLPRSTLMAFTTTFAYPNSPTPEPVFPGNFDILHGQHLYRPDGVDVDLYRFTIDIDAGRSGVLTAETFAERLPNSSLLDTVLTVYRENSDGTREVIARNDDYYSRDSFIQLDLGAGVYYVAVSATGNTSFDPTISNTGIGGTSQGAYDLRLNFRSQVDDENVLRDQDGAPTALDGDLDGTPGGAHNFWFQTRSLNRVLTLTADGTGYVDGQVVTITNSTGIVRRFEFDNNNSVGAGNSRVTFSATTTAAQMAQNLAGAIASSPGFGVVAIPVGNRVTLGDPLTQAGSERSVSLTAGFAGLRIEGRTVFVDKIANPNADGTLARPFNNIAATGVANAFAAARPGDIVRIVGNGGLDQDLSTPNDNSAYEIGFGTLTGQTLSDGTEMAVPKGVTVMVDGGAVFKLRRSFIGVGSTSLTVDRSGGSLQVLGAPVLVDPQTGAVERTAAGDVIPGSVYFTSWLDESLGRDTNPAPTVPGRGDWGGIMFRATLDAAESRPSLEDQGIFLNYINQADIRYGGGGGVVIDGIQQVVNPIQMSEVRPTITFNRITLSADSAMSASPNSFIETNFHSPRFQSTGVFTSDYDRVGPKIRGNTLRDNTSNALFVRIETPAGDALRPLTVAGRFDDVDIVHLLAENLVIEGSQGEPFLDLSRPAVQLITFSNISNGTLAAGTYAYKVTFVDANGFEGRPSLPTGSVTITPANVVAGLTAIRLNQLPPASGDYVARRLYRTDDPVNGTYRLVTQLNASDTVFIDRGGLIGDVLQRDPPPSSGVTLTVQQRGSLAAGTYNYRIVFVDVAGREGASSDATASLLIPGAPGGGGILLDNLPIATGAFVARRIYRSRANGAGPYELAAEMDASTATYLDDGFTLGGELDPGALGVIRARPHARLAIDPGTVVKLEGARFESRFGGQLIAEGLPGRQIIFTSRLDDSYGAGGTFDTNDDDRRGVLESLPTPGDWGGLYFGPLGTLSVDYALLAYGGGQNKIEGTTTSFNVIELHQAAARITNSVIEDNANGIGGQGPLDRFGRGFNMPSTIFVRGSQPVIVGNIIRDNVNPPPSSFNPANGNGARDNAAITINLNSLTHEVITDVGRSRGLIDRVPGYGDNRGPLVRDNRLDNNGLNGMVVRGEELTTQSVWDDTDIVHIVTNRYDDTRFGWRFDEILIPDFHTFGGVRLQSSPAASLVVKLEGRGNLGQLYNLNPTNGAGFTATGRPLEIEDRIGGILHVVGQPGFPVVMTSIHDDTVGAGIRPNDLPQTDTNNNGIATTPSAGDWRSVRLDQFSHDRNVEIVTELELATETAPGRNATTDSAQFLGVLAPRETSGDRNLRMGFELQGFLNEPRDIDVYSFSAAAGSEIWLDIDRSTFSLDTVVEFLDSNGNVLARSNDSVAGEESIEFVDPSLQSRSQNLVNPLQRSPVPYYPTQASGLPRDYYSINPRDAGMRVALPGNAGTQSDYYVRIRSNNGLTSGVYQFQVRMKEFDEFPGSTVRFADIRYAQNGIEVLGHPAHSPLLGEASEDEGLDPFLASNNSLAANLGIPGQRAQDLGNLYNSDRGVFSIGGAVSTATDVDFYTFDVRYDAISERSIHHGAVMFDLDYADSLNRPNTSLAVFDAAGQLILVARDSNIAEDRPGPLAGSDLADLSRGSVGPGDPFIGPIELPEGTYFVAVTSNARMPLMLEQFTTANPANPVVRLEPANSLIRIAEDHVESSGGSTAAPPVVPTLLDRTTLGPSSGLWQVTTNRQFNPGHGLPAVFDGSRGAVAFTGDIEPNNTLATAQSVESGPWNTGFNINIGDFFTNTSTTIPHLTIDGTGDGSYDYFSFDVTTVPASLILDLDFGDTGGPGSFDADLGLWNAANGNLVSFAFDSPASWGAAGSVGFADPFLPITITTPGTYIVGVGEWPTFPANGGFTGPGVPANGTYQLNISLQNHPIGSSTVGGVESFYFGDTTAGNTVPDGASGRLDSQPFSLAGYSAKDLPVLYFNYFLDNVATTDEFTVSVVNSAGASTLVASGDPADVTGSISPLFQTNAGTFRQARVDLSAFAGQQDLRLRFNFAKISTATIEGAYVDDLVIGFAERGEMVTGATVNSTFIANPNAPGAGNEVLVGDYQLEIRKANEFATSGDFGARTLRLDRSIDTNDRLAQQTTLIAPHGSEVREEQTFTINDGVNSVTFEYEDPEIGNGVSEEGRVEIRFKTPDATSPTGFRLSTNYEIAARIRDAINSPQVQTQLFVRAAMADGTDAGTTSRDARVNLFGTAIVDQPPPFTVATTNDPNRLRDTILGTGITAAGTAQFTGGPSSAATFVGGDSLFGMENGILLSTGDAGVADQPNTNDSTTGRASGSGDPRLDAAFGVSTRDTSALEFTFNLDDTFRNDLALNFVFASEEYNESIGSIGDVLAVFIDGVDISDNIAVVDVMGVDQPVSIETINSGNPFDPTGVSGVNANLYFNNDISDGGSLLDRFGYDGFTAVLTARIADLDPLVPHRIVIAISDVEDGSGDSAIFLEQNSLIAYDSTDVTMPDRFVQQPTGIPNVRHTGFGDQNVFRDQGQVLIHSNTIRDSADFGVVTTAGDRDSVENAINEPGTPVMRLQSHVGPTRRLRDLNDLGNAGLIGGFTPGVVVENNTISGEGLGGIHISGNVTPLELTIWPDAGTNTSGDHFCDGDVFSLTVGRQTSVFEFVDVSGSGATDNTRPCIIGSGGTVAWTAGRVPIFYRRTDASQSGYSPREMANAIKEAIDNSPLIDNQTTHVSQAYVTSSRASGSVGILGFTVPNDAVYVERVAHFDEVHHPSIGPSIFETQRFMPIGYAGQPFVLAVNNTIYGNDGSASFFPVLPAEPDDTLAAATQTMQGRAHNPEFYSATAELGDSVNFRDAPEKDVDFYQFEMDIGDRVTINLDTTINQAGRFGTVLRLLNSVGEELLRDDDWDPTVLIDPVLDFIAPRAGTYYVAVSGLGNSEYSPISLADRAVGETGDYRISVNVQAPREFLIDMEDLLGVSQFDITDIGSATLAPRTIQVTGAGGANTAAAAQNLAIAINSAGLIGVSASLIGGRTWNYHIRDRQFRDYERYVVVRGPAQIEGVAGAVTELLPRFTDDNNNLNDNNEDQLLREAGILITEAATPTLMNNVLVNLRNGVVETAAYRDFIDRFHHRDLPQDDLVRFNAFSTTTHPVTAVKTGLMFQYNPFGNQGTSLPPNSFGIGQSFSVSSGLMFENIERYDGLIDTVDFNIPVPNIDPRTQRPVPMFVNAPNGNFFPAPSAPLIDSSVDTLGEREQFELVKTSAGIALSPILSPETDAVGQLRVDDPAVDTPQGQGANVFKDRGSLDRSDFIGPAALLVTPQDNDADERDLDPAVSTVQLTSGVFTDFTIQIVDGFESVDPFPGVGVNDDTLDGRIVPVTEDSLSLQLKGPAVTVFQDGVYLREGIDYTYRFDRTNNTIRLTPLTGIWPSGKAYVIKVNNRDRFVIDAEAGTTVADGQTFQITNDIGDTVTMEFESGYSIQVTPTLGVQIPLQGGGPGGIVDGQRFTVDDGVTVLTFEFDRNGNVLPGNLPVPYLSTSTADDIADSMVAALQQASDLNLIQRLVPRNIGGGFVHLGASPAHDFDFSNATVTPSVIQRPFSLIVPPGGGADIADNESFTITDGTNTVVFEFDSDGILTVPGSVRIPFDSSLTADIVAGLIRDAINSPNGAVLNLSPVALPGGIVELNATPSHSVDVRLSSLTRTMFVGGVGDGERFEIRNGNQAQATFEFDNDGSFIDVNNDTVPDFILLPFDQGSTHLDLAQLIADSIRNAGVGLDPANVGNGLVNLGGTVSHTLDAVLAPSLQVLGQPGVRASTTLHLPVAPAIQVPAQGAGLGGVVDGERFSISDGLQTVIFEFDSDLTTIPGNTPIPFFFGQTQADLALTIAAVLQTANLGLNTQVLGNGVILLGASANHVINLVGSSLTRSDRVGTLNDGEFFTVTDGTNQVAFEFEDLSVNDGVQPGRTPIRFALNSPVDVVANALAAALAGAGLNLSPIYANDGSGRVEMGDTVRHLTSIVPAPSLTRSGAAGGAQAILYRLNFDEDQVAKAIVAGINASSVRISGVSSQLRGGSTLFVDISDSQGQPANFTTGFAAMVGIPNFFLPAVKDLPGNRLKANQATNETQFTILLPGVVLDYGDLPDSPNSTPSYPTLRESNGARHVITSNPLFLGAIVDDDLDGQPTKAADGDDFDLVFDVSGAPLAVTSLPPYAIQAPAGGAADINDNQTFSIRRGTAPPIRFEFDKNSSGLSGGSHELISLSASDSQATVAEKIVDAVKNRLNDLVLRPVHVGGGVVVLGATETQVNNVLVPSHTIDLAGSPLQPTGRAPLTLTTPGAGLSLSMPTQLRMQVPLAGGGGLTDGTTFSINDTVHPEVVFEFDIEGNFNPDNRRITFSTLLSQSAMADEIVAAIQLAVDEGLLNGLAPEHLGNGLIDLGAHGAHQLDVGNTSLTQAGPIADGDTFTIADVQHTPVTFEFDTDPTNTVAPGRERIAISLTNSADEISNAIVTAIKNVVLANRLVAIDPIYIGEGVIDVDAPAPTPTVTVTVTTPAGITLKSAGTAGGMIDGDSFTVDNGLGVTRFEFDRNENRVVTPGSQRVGFSVTASAGQVADAIGDAVNGLTPIVESASLGAGLSITVPARQELIVPPAGGAAIVDSAFFSVSSPGQPPVLFEFDSNTVVTPTRRPIPFTLGMTRDEVADAIVAAVQQAVTDGALPGLAPVNLGLGVVNLGTSATHSVDASVSSLAHRGPVSDGDTLTLAATGQTPVVVEFDLDGNIAPGNHQLPVVATQSAEAIAIALASEIQLLSTQMQLPLLASKYLTGGLVDINVSPGLTIASAGSPIVAGVAGGIADGQTFVFTDELRSSTFEFDRTVENSVVAGNVRIPFAANATGEEIGAAIRSAFRGSGVTIAAVSQSNGQVTLRNSDDNGVPFQRINDDDGVRVDGIFTPVIPGDPLRANLTTRIVVTSSGEGFLDAWFDWNQDGDFSDPNEARPSIPVVAGENIVFVTVPSSATLGDTFARYRLSSAGNLQPTGLAVDGEVEDYRIRVISNARPELIGIGIPDIVADEDNETGEATPDRTIDASMFFNDIDISNGNGDFLTFTAVSDRPSQVAASVDGNLINLDYLKDQNGAVNVTVTVTDHGGLTLVQTFSVTIAKKNLAPAAHARDTDDTDVDTLEDTPVVITLTGDDLDPLPTEVQTLTFLLCPSVGNPAIGTVSGFTSVDDHTANVTYTPPAEFNGVATFTFCVRDDGNAGPPANLQSQPATVRINVNRVNDPPVAVAVPVFSQTPTEDTSVFLTLEGTDVDAIGGQQLTFDVPATTVRGGTLTFDQRIDANRVRYLYTPALNVNGGDTFAFTVTDQDNGNPPDPRTSAPATVTIPLVATNDTPLANDQAVTVVEDMPTPITLNADDGDPEVSQLLVLAIVTPPSHGALGAINPATGQVTYTPTPGYVGPDSFSYQIVQDDGTAGNPPNLPSTRNGIVTIDVIPTNDRPTITVPASPVPIVEDTPTVFTIRVDDGDPEFNQVLTFLSGNSPANGTIQFQGFQSSGSLVDARFLYTPNANYNGPDSFSFSLRDNGLPNETSVVATIPLTVTPVNDPPVAGAVSTSTLEDNSVTITLVGNDGDPLPTENQTLIFEIVANPTRGTLGPINQIARTVTYTPNPDTNGTDSFTYRVRDDGTAGAPANLFSAPATASVTVNPVNDAPVFTAGPNVVVDEDAGLQTVIGWASGVRPGPATATDEGNQVITFTVTNSNNALFTTGGQPSVSSSGTLTFTPAADRSGTAVVTLFARDNGSGVPPNANQSAPQSFTITVNPINDAPQFRVGPDVSVNEDAGPQSLTAWARPNGTPILPGPPTATDEASQVLTFNFQVETTGNLVFTAGPNIDPVTGNLTYTTAPHTNGLARVTVRLSDNGDGSPPNVNISEAQVFNISVNALNDAPEFTVPQPAIVRGEDAGLVRVTGFATNLRPGPIEATDESGQTLTFITTVTSLQGGLSFVTPPTVNSAGELSFLTSPDKHGSAVILVRLQDNGSGFPPQANLSAPQTATITINSVNDPPQFTVGSDQQTNEDAGPQSVIGWATGIRPGPTTAADEGTQTVTFTTTTDNDALFSVAPSVSPNGTLSYTPAPNASGTALVTVTATDSGVPPAQVSQPFRITISPVNDAPTLTVPPLQTIAEDLTLAFGGTTAISVADIDANQVQVTLRAANGVLTVQTNVPGGLTPSDILNNGTGTVTLTGSPTAINATLAAASGLTYQGNLNFNGFDSIAVFVDDLGNTGLPGPLSTSETVRINVTQVNDPPVLANPITDLTVSEDSPKTLIELFPRVFNDPDIVTNNDSLQLRVVNNTNASLVSTAIVGATILELTLLPNRNGQSVITLEATDRAGATVQDTFTLTVLAVNDPPLAVNDTLQAQSNVTSNLNVLANDTDVDGTIDIASVQITSAPNNATVSVNADGSIRFTPATNFNGVSKFRYAVQDNNGALSNEAEVSVTVNAPPVAVNDQAATTQGVPVVIDVPANDTDSDGTINRATVTITQQPANGTVSVNGTTGEVTYTPGSTFNGVDTFRYTVRDNAGGLSNAATVTVEVTPTRFWQNQPNRLDVNDDGRVSPIDVLQIVNRLNSHGPGPLPVPSPGFSPPPYYDVNGDGNITPADALIVINAINDGQGGEGEFAGFGVAAQPGGEAAPSFAVLVAPAFSEYRYVPLAGSNGCHGELEASESLASGSGDSAEEQIDYVLSDLSGQDSGSGGSTSPELAPPVEDAASCLVAGLMADIDRSLDGDSAVDTVLDELFGDTTERG